MILSRTYYMIPGATNFYNPDFYNVKLLGVTRSGLYYTRVEGEADPVGMQFKVDSFLGLVFDPNIPFLNLEKLSVLWDGEEIIEPG